jgi:hypothetical protein
MKMKIHEYMNGGMEWQDEMVGWNVVKWQNGMTERNGVVK